MNYNDPRIEKFKNMTLGEMFDSVFDSRKKEREEAIRRCAELEEENRKLREVVEAAEALINGCKPIDCKPVRKERNFDCVTQCRWFALKEAIVALDGNTCRNCGAPLTKCGPELWKAGKKCCPECTHGAVTVEDDDGYPD